MTNENAKQKKHSKVKIPSCEFSLMCNSVLKSDMSKKIFSRGYQLTSVPLYNFQNLIIIN